MTLTSKKRLPFYLLILLPLLVISETTPVTNLTASEWSGLIGAISGLAGLVGVIITIFSVRSNNRKANAQAISDEANAKKTQAETDVITQKTQTNAIRVISDANSVLTSGLRQRVQELEEKVRQRDLDVERIHKDKNKEIDDLKIASLKQIRKNNKVRFDLEELVRTNIEARNQAAQVVQCPQACRLIDQNLKARLEEIMKGLA